MSFFFFLKAFPLQKASTVQKKKKNLRESEMPGEKANRLQEKTLSPITTKKSNLGQKKIHNYNSEGH